MSYHYERRSRSHITTTTAIGTTKSTATITTVLTIPVNTVLTTAITTIVAITTILTITTTLTTKPIQPTTATMPTTLTATKKPAHKPYLSRPLFTAFGLKPLRTHTLSPSQETCSICLTPFTDAEPAHKILRCTHVFHNTCLSTWLDAAKTSSCPTCRAELFVLPGKARREARNPRRDLQRRREGVWRVPRLRRESDEEEEVEVGRREDVLRGMVGEGVEGVVVQSGFGTVARWRMEALGLGDGGVNVGVQEVILDY